MAEGSRLARWRGLAGIAGRRVVARITQTERQQTRLTVMGIAVAVGLLLVVTSVGLGMLAQSTVGSADTDYWIVPEGAASSAVTDVNRQQLGRVHPATERIARRDGVTYATPVLMTLVRANASGTADTSYLIVLGVIPSSNQETLVGLPTTRLTDGDPHYANGSYDGPWTGDAVLSTGAADTLGVSRGGSFRVAAGRRGATAPRRSFTAVAVRETHAAGIGQFPVAVVHLSELQALTGASRTDSADQILVAAADATVRPHLEGVYPGADVVTRGGLLVKQSRRSKLPVAISLSAFAVAVVVGTLFVCTTMGMAIAAGSHQRAVLSALGFAPTSRAVVVALQALMVALLGGGAGVGLAVLGVTVTNGLVTTFLSDVPIATFRPLLVAYGLGVALLIGVLSLPYLVAVSLRRTTMEAITR